VLIRSVREANQNFSRLVADVEGGETVLITKNGRPVAEVRPVADDRTGNPAWRAAHERLCAVLDAIPDDGYRVGEITHQDKRGRSRR
jgi:prevent-host-death family protein